MKDCINIWISSKTLSLNCILSNKNVKSWLTFLWCWAAPTCGFVICVTWSFWLVERETVWRVLWKSQLQYAIIFRCLHPHGFYENNSKLSIGEDPRGIPQLSYSYITASINTSTNIKCWLFRQQCLEKHYNILEFRALRAL